MKVDSGHRNWAIATAVLLAGSAALYWIASRTSGHGGEHAGGSIAGLAFGIAGAGLIVFAALLGWRRKRPALRIGRAATWMKGHLWLGTLAGPLILFHGGFSIGGPLTAILLVLLFLVIASGFYGLALQQFLPRLMTDQLPLETIYEEIPHVLEQLVADMDARIAAAAPEAESAPGTETAPAAAGSESLRVFYATRVRPWLLHSAAGGTRDREFERRESATAVFARMRIFLSPALHDALDDLAEACEERRQLALQERLHAWLHTWVLVHAPLTMALLVLSALHAVWALRY